MDFRESEGELQGGQVQEEDGAQKGREGGEKKNTTHRKKGGEKNAKMSYREEDAGRAGSDE